MKKELVFGSLGAMMLVTLLVLGGWFVTAQVQAAPSAKAQLKSGMVSLTQSTTLRVNVVNTGKTEVTGVLKFADAQGKIQSFQCNFHLGAGQAMWMDVKGSDEIIGPERKAFRAIVVVNDSALAQNVIPTIEVYHTEGGNTTVFYSFE